LFIATTTAAATAAAADAVCAVMQDPEFRARWPGDKQRMFVAQASLMMFRSGPARQLFARWEARRVCLRVSLCVSCAVARSHAEGDGTGAVA
jgi:hypothetical protein